MSETLYTLVRPNSHQAEIRKSRFVAQAAAIDDVEAALQFVRQASDPEASHNCWAYRLGQQYRFNDDGEPSGSAGKPILAAIDGQNLDGVAVVVTRWFGGTKLGIGGLIRAYGGTAAQCLRLGATRPVIATVSLTLDCGYGELERLRAPMQKMGVRVQEEEFGALGVTLQLALPDAHLDALRRQVADITRGQGSVTLNNTDPSI